MSQENRKMARAIHLDILIALWKEVVPVQI